jgi:NOL1/NOP2/sun family putative RNA methylase
VSRELPNELLASLKGVPGFDEIPFKEIHTSGQQVTSVRFNPAKVSEEDIDDHIFPGIANGQHPASLVPWCSTGRYLPQRPSFTFDPLFHAGAYYVQEASSMFLDHVVKSLFADEPPQRVLDLCAAPGGKSTLLAARFPDSFIVSNEVIKNRVTILAENLSKWGSSNVAVTHSDPKDFKRLPGYFDLVVVDAPCSGSGLFRKDQHAIEEWSEANVMMCSHRQQRILADAISSLKQNGYLVYSTCSYSSAEDEDICDWIVENLDLKPVAIPIDQAWGIVETFSTKHNAPGYRFYPDKVKGEGFFIACFRQENPADEYEGRTTKLASATKEEQRIVEPWLDQPRNYQLFRQKETIIAFPLKWQEEFTTVQKNLSVRKSGVAIGVIKGSDLIPHHEFALSGLLNPNLKFVELNEIQALRYLRRQDLVLDTSVKGWALARYKHLNLGWMKVLGNRVNNYYPIDWRILKP